MAEYRTRAIVLRHLDYGESDRLVHLYCETLGRVSALAKGARRSKRRFPGTLEIFTVAELRIVDPPRASLMRLESAKQVSSYEGLVNDLGRYAIACQFLEVLDRLTGDREANPEFFAFAIGVLDVLREEEPDRLLALMVQTKTLGRLGYRPLFANCTQCGDAITLSMPRVGFSPRHGGAVCPNCAGDETLAVSPRVLLGLEQGLRSPLRERDQLGFAEADVKRAEGLLDRFYRFQIGLELKSAEFVREALAAKLLGGAHRPDPALS